MVQLIDTIIIIESCLKLKVQLQFQFFPQVVNGVTTYSITITSVAVAMILGILVNLVLKDDDKKEVESNEELIEEEKNILDNK